MNHAFLVGTHSGLYHTILNPDFELLSCKQLLKGHHYGLSIHRDANRIYSKSQDEYFNVMELDTLNYIDKIYFKSKPGHVHQALVTKEGIYLTDTLNNRMTFQDHDGNCSHFVIDGHSEDVNHLNSIFLLEGEIACLLHNLGKRTSEVQIVGRDENGNFVQTNRWSLQDNGCHNIYIKSNQTLYNSSDIGNVVRIANDTGAVLARSEFDGHSKGLSVTDDFVVAGVSDHAVRDARRYTSSSLLILNSEDLSLKKQIPIKTDGGDLIGNINEIRCISSHDYSEGLGGPMA